MAILVLRYDEGMPIDIPEGRWVGVEQPDKKEASFMAPTVVFYAGRQKGCLKRRQPNVG